MKKFFYSLLFIGGCLFFFIIGFSSGQLTFLAANQGIQVETENLRMKIIFKSEAGSVEKSICTASLRLYADVLSLCLSEPEDLEKVISAEILAEFVAKSGILNILRSRIREEKKKTLEENNSGGKYIL